MKNNNRIGYISNSKVKGILFAIITCSIFIAAMVIILSIWDYIGNDIAAKVVGTLGTIIAGGMLFSWVNDLFGVNQSD